MPHSGSRHPVVCHDPLPALEHGFEPAVGLHKLHDEVRADVQSFALAEPIGVVREHTNRNGIDLIWTDAAVLEISLERLNSRAVEMPIRTGAQEHPARHVLSPEAHGQSYHRRVDPLLASKGSR